MTRVLYPGSFDPIHNGHVEIVRTASRVFDEVIVAVVVNPGKGSGMFAADERVELIAQVCLELVNVSTTTYSNLVVRLAAELEVDFVIKGLRASSDFESEMRMAQINKAISGVETMFLPSTSESSFIASRYIREIAAMGGDVSSLVPGPVLTRIRAKMEIS